MRVTEEVADRPTIEEPSSHLRNEKVPGTDAVTERVSDDLSITNGVVYGIDEPPFIEYDKDDDAPPVCASVTVRRSEDVAYSAEYVTEVAGDAGIAAVYVLVNETIVEADSHLRNESEEWVDGASITSVSLLETLNGTVYAVALSEPILYVIAAPDGVDAKVTETTSVVNAKFAVNVTEAPV